jgi:NADH-quinone oxidoreductase subunit F
LALLLTRASGAPRETLAEYAAAGGYEALAHAYAGTLAADEIIRRVTESGLRGHGGAGFPTGRKWALAAAVDAPKKYVVANGGEHEPGSRKDRFLLESYPHRVLEGTLLCARATGASGAWIYVIEDMADAIASVRAAIDEAGAAGHLAGVDVQVTLAPTTYVAGEESAALEVIEGKKAWPRKKPPYPGQPGGGLWGAPTTVNNVETLAWVPGIAREGAAWFGAGALLCTLDDSMRRPGIHEVALGTTFRTLVYDLGGGPRGGGAVKAILPALSSAFLGASALDLAMTYDGVKAAGSGLGCGGVSILEEGGCAVERVLEIARFFKREQCGQCPPCRMETNTLAAVLEKVHAGAEAGEYVAQAEKIAAFARGKGNCSLIEMAAAPVLSALRLFPDDFAHHAEHGRCPG